MKARALPVILLVLSGLMLLVSIFLLHAYRGDATPVTIENRSGVMLRSVVVSGSGFRASVREIEPGTSAKVYVYPDGESGLGIVFEANGRAVSVPSSGYIEGGGGYSLTLAIDSDLKASLVHNDSTLHMLFKFL